MLRFGFAWGEEGVLCFNGFELFYLCGGLGGLCFQYAVLFIFLKFGFAQIGVRSKEAKANEESMTPRSPSPLTFPTACMDLNACGWTLSTACTGLCFVIRLRLAWLACVSPPEDCMNLDDINHNTHTQHMQHATNGEAASTSCPGLHWVLPAAAPG